MATFWFYVALVAGIFFLILKVSLYVANSSILHKARKLRAAGNWKEAANYYKKSIIAELESENRLSVVVKELQELYLANDVSPDFTSLLECPTRIKEIYAMDYGTTWAPKLKSGEKGERVGIIYKQTTEFLDTLP